MPSITGTPGAKVDLTRVGSEREGYTLAGWYADKDLQVPIKETVLNADRTLYAKWIEKTGGDEIPVDPTPAPTLPFIDVPEGVWYYDEGQVLFDKGLMVGVSDTEFAPMHTTTRGMIVAMLYRMENNPDVSAFPNPFEDVPEGEWYRDGVVWAAAQGIVVGYGEGQYGPQDPITREQLAAILMNYAEFKNEDVSARADLTVFADGAAVSDWAETSVAWANAMGIIRGDGNQLMPRDPATRAQVAAAFHHVMGA